MQNINLSRVNFSEFENFKNANKASVVKFDLVYDYINKKGFDDVANDLLCECLGNLIQCQTDFEIFYNCVISEVDINQN